jgi:hypothetical protein
LVLGEVVVNERRYAPIEPAVITAMGIYREKKTLTTSIQSISGAELRGVVDDPDFIAGMSGRIAGFNPTKETRGAGPADINIILRGQKSFTERSAPLLVIDGVPMGLVIGSALSHINPDDVESITVFPSANAAMLYGSAGANGAIVVTLKNGVRR